jgi:hypothetical protein
MPYTELVVGPVDRVRLLVGAIPMPTLVSVLTNALGGPDQGVPAQVSRLVSRH